MIDEPTAPSEELEDELDEELPFLPSASVADDIRDEIQAKLEELRAEFGTDNVSELMIDAALDEKIGAFVLEAEDALRAASEALHGKARFTMHREPNGDLYVMRNLKPSEWRTQWLQILSGEEEFFNRYADAVLKACMIYPTFDQTDWEYEGPPRMHAPLGLTKTRLVGAFFEQELTDPNQPTSVTFTAAQLEGAKTVAKRHPKPSL